MQLLPKIVKGTYGKGEKDVAPFGYDYWYQPYHNVMISTEWGHPRCFTKGLDVADVAAGNYGTHINVFDWENKELVQRIDLGMEGVMPLEIRLVSLFHSCSKESSRICPLL